MSNHIKGLQFKHMCRGSGKIFAIVTIPADCGYEYSVLSSTLDDGTEVPSKCCEMEAADNGDRRFIVTVAVLDVAQTVQLRLYDESGDVVAQALQKIDPRIAQLSSKVHTLLKDTGVSRIRNYDLGDLFDEYQVALTRIVAIPNEIDVVQGEAVCVSANQELLEQEVDVVLCDRAGRSVSLEGCVILRDSTNQRDDSPSYWTRIIQFSFRITRDLGSFVIWIKPRSEARGALTGFVTFEPHVVWDVRNQWYANALPAMIDPFYSEFYHARWEASPFELELQRRVTFDPCIKFSIVVPLYRTPLQFLDEMVASVLGQSYSNFELVLVNASTDDVQLTQRVLEWASQDERIVVVSLDENLGIAQNTAAGVERATGEFVCLLDHDDTLSPDALFCYAKALEEYPNTDMLYSDEDHIENGVHKNPYFKPDWNPDLLLGMNYVCHFLAIRKSVMDAIGPIAAEFDGAQDHYLALQASRLARNIFHCRRVLYHWRMHSGSTANNEGEKPYAQDAGLKAVQAYLDASGIDAEAAHSTRALGRYEVNYRMDKQPLVSILIPNKDSAPVLDRCLKSIREKTTYENYEVVIIENNSTDDETFAYYEKASAEDSRVRVVRYEGVFNFAAINNLGAANARGDYYLLLNNDTEVITPDWLERMVSLCSRTSTGIVGAKLLYPDRTIQHAGVMTLQHSGPAHMNMFRDATEIGPGECLRLVQDVSAVTGACLLTSAAVWDELGGMDEEFPVDYNDVDYCWSVRESGRLVVFDPSVELFHYESVSRGFHPSLESDISFESAKGRLRVKWPDRYAKTDPYGNPNFDQARGYLNLAK